METLHRNGVEFGASMDMESSISSAALIYRILNIFAGALVRHSI